MERWMKLLWVSIRITISTLIRSTMIRHNRYVGLPMIWEDFFFPQWHGNYHWFTLVIARKNPHKILILWEYTVPKIITFYKQPKRRGTWKHKDWTVVIMNHVVKDPWPPPENDMTSLSWHIMSATREYKHGIFLFTTSKGIPLWKVFRPRKVTNIGLCVKKKKRFHQSTFTSSSLFFFFSLSF